MIDLSRIFGRRKVASKDLAKDRLKLVLVHDRANSDTDLLEEIKDEIMKVLEKYMDVSDSGLDIQITTAQSEDGTSTVPALTANIPIKAMKRK